MSNVDSQESFKNIVVQVIGEMSNRAAPHRKFVQTFVLAEQPNGYFVLNDIFRYIEDEEDDIEMEEPTAPVQAARSDEPVAAMTGSNDHAQQQHDIEEVDHKLEEELEAEKAAPEEPLAGSTAAKETTSDATTGDSIEEVPAGVASDEQRNIPPQDADKAAEAEAAEPERPRDPDPTPVASPPKPTPAAPTRVQAPVAPAKPAAPKTWANLVAANRAAAPAVPSPASSASPIPSQPKNTPSSTSSPANPPAPSANDSQVRTQPNGNAGWQTAGTDNNRRQARGQSISGSTEKETVLGYVKNVTDKVDASILKSVLNQYGKLAYFDVSRSKVSRQPLA